MSRLLIQADGGARQNPGPAGYGAVVMDADTGAVLAERAGGLGHASNNVAEYRGLIAGLTAAGELAASSSQAVESVLVQMDSKLVVEQMSGRWKVKHPDMAVLAREAAGLVRSLPPVRFEWIPRERNKHADRLANEAMDAQAEGRAWEGETEASLPVFALDLTTPPALAAPAPSPSPSAPSPSAPPVSAPPVSAPAAKRLPGWSPVSTEPLTTLLLRHGQTPLSADKRFSGRGNPALTELGRAQAADAAIRIGDLVDGGVTVSRLISSPLQRARETAAVVGTRLGLTVEVDDRLMETDFGVWEGSTFAEVRAQWPDELAAWMGSPEVAPPGGESFADTLRRVAELKDDWLAAGPATILAVSHVSPIKSFAQLALDASPAVLYRLHLDLCGLTTLDWYADGPASVRGWNALT